MKNNAKNRLKTAKIQKNDNIYALKIKTESNNLGVLKTLIVILLIILQASILVLSYLYFSALFEWYFILSLALTFVTCIYVLSSDYHGQAKATWIFFLLISFGFGYLMYFMSDKRVLFAKSKKKYNKIIFKTQCVQKHNSLTKIKDMEVKANCEYLYRTGNFVTHFDSKTRYFSSGTQLFDDILENLEKAKNYIFIEYFIISNGVLLDRFLEILKQKAKEGVDVRIIYDDMGSHGTLKRKTKKDIISAGIKLQHFNRLVPVFNIALNLRNHRKIVVIDGEVSYTGGANLADEYTNEKRMHGYWKDCGIKVSGKATDNLTIAFLQEWQFLTNQDVDYANFLSTASAQESDGVVVPFVSGPNYSFSIAQNMYANVIAGAKERLYIMTPYFIPDETITNLLINKARSGVDVRIILPDVADKKYVYIVSRNNAEKLLACGARVYTMTHSFVHSKVMLTENSAIVGSINMDLRSFNQQFESAVYTNQKETMQDIRADFDFAMAHSQEITPANKRRNRVSYRAVAGLFNLISPFM